MPPRTRPARPSRSSTASTPRRTTRASASGCAWSRNRGPTAPWDSSEVRDPNEGRVDLGGLFVPGVDGMELRVEVAGDAIVAATVVLGDSAVQLQAFAAEIATGITQQGGIVDEVEGPLGWELRAQVPVQLPDGTGGFPVFGFFGGGGPPRFFPGGVFPPQGRGNPKGPGFLKKNFSGDPLCFPPRGPKRPPPPPFFSKNPKNPPKIVPKGGPHKGRGKSPFFRGMGEILKRARGTYQSLKLLGRRPGDGPASAPPGTWAASLGERGPFRCPRRSPAAFPVRRNQAGVPGVGGVKGLGPVAIPASGPRGSTAGRGT
ncbi:conserved hypothetical protein [Streptomyces sp. e14]|nr:conserved hypothetical protein [Streptomyces sp. e14]